MTTRSANPGFWRGWGLALVVLLALVGGVGIGEWLGWPFLARPLQQWLSERLDRRVSLSAEFGTSSPSASASPAESAAGSTASSTASSAPALASRSASGLRLRFLGGIAVQAPQLEIGAPSWSQTPHLMRARDVVLHLRYADLWRAYRNQALRIHSLQASALDVHLERLADGRASWQFKPPPAPAPELPSFGQLRFNNGTLIWRDALSATQIDAQLTLAASAAPDRPGGVLQAQGSGHYRDLPVKLELLASGAMPWLAEAEQQQRLPLTLKASVGSTRLNFNGSAVDALQLRGLIGHVSLSGPSLAAVGDPVGVTLPTTGAFRSQGVIVKDGPTWSLRLDEATVGASHLSGAFTYQTGASVPLLSGRLSGRRLLLADLGPAVGAQVMTPGGTPVRTVRRAPDSKTTVSTAAPSSSARVPSSASSRRKGRILPDRPFDLAALRNMNANVLIDIAEVDLNTPLLEPLRPLRGHLQLTGGVLTLRKLEARSGQGQLLGDLSLDGRTGLALWTTELRWDGIRLERSIRQRSQPGMPAYVAGRLSGRSSLVGQGRSTAEILSSLNGQAYTELHEGSVSNLVLEVAGLDVAQSLGLLFTGDERLPVSCAVASLVAERGVFSPRVMVFDTSDTTVWIDGSLSLANETMDLRALVAPKDFSPLTLRTSLRVHGSFDNPEVSLDKEKLGLKLAASFLLGLVNPLAALLPLIDPGDTKAARQAAAGCHALTQRATSAKSASARPAPVRGSQRSAPR